MALTTQSPATIPYTDERVGVDLDEINRSNHPKVMIVEDDFDTLSLLKQILVRSGFNVSGAMSGQEALSKLSIYDPDIVLLDVMMPEMDGWETMRMLSNTSDVPVILVTALATKENVIKGFQAGVDDYIIKPFYKDEIVARIRAILHRTKRKTQKDIIHFDNTDLTIDCHSQEVKQNGKTFQMTSKEFAVLLTLAKQFPSAVTYREMAMTVWGEDKPQIRQRIKYIIYLLRQKFKELDQTNPYISNVGRLGYRFSLSGKEHKERE
jgi:DNA-binding response OmpR family regulator